MSWSACCGTIRATWRSAGRGSTASAPCSVFTALLSLEQVSRVLWCEFRGAASVARRVGSGGTRRHDTDRLGAQVDEHRRTAREVEDDDPGVPQRGSAGCAGWEQATPAELLSDDRRVPR